MPLLEVCVETIDEALAAAEAGAGRLEVCACMSEAGTTPSVGLVSEILERVSIPVVVMVRPRGGDFTYTPNELKVMLRDIASMKQVGVHGIVSGVLEPTLAIDREATAKLVDASTPLPFTFHRAFDLAPELEDAVVVLRNLAVTRILTSGGASTAIVGAGAIARLARLAGAMTLLAGGGVRAPHVAELLQVSGVSEVHARPVIRRRDRGVGREVRFGATAPGGERGELDMQGVRELVSALRTLASS